jgi:NADH:ubiquinone reductase (H+-translocating)
MALDKVSMAVVGKGCAVLQSGKVKVSGFRAWLTWAFVRLQFLATSSLRLSVFLHWVWPYFTGQRGSELIVNHHGQQPMEAAEEVSSKPAANSERAIHDRPAGIYN